jgi:hypothetical protein
VFVPHALVDQRDDNNWINSFISVPTAANLNFQRRSVDKAINYEILLFGFVLTELFEYVISYLDDWRKNHPVLRFWAGPFPMFLIYTAEAAEVMRSFSL